MINDDAMVSSSASSFSVHPSDSLLFALFPGDPDIFSSKVAIRKKGSTRLVTSSNWSHRSSSDPYSPPFRSSPLTPRSQPQHQHLNLDLQVPQRLNPRPQRRRVPVRLCPEKDPLGVAGALEDEFTSGVEKEVLEDRGEVGEDGVEERGGEGEGEVEFGCGGGRRRAGCS